MTLTVVRDRLGNAPVKAAEVTIEGQQLRIKTDTKVLSNLIQSVLSRPTKIKIRNGNKVTKVRPTDATQDLRCTLKQNLYDPYRLAHSDEKLEDNFQGQYEDIVTLNILRGESRHELVTR
jgi:hypothetical protein